MSDWRDTRFHLTTLFFERVFAPLSLLLWALLALVLVMGLVTAVIY